METFFIYLYRFFSVRRSWFYSIFIAAFLLMAFFATRLKFEEDITAILPKEKNIEKLNEIFQNSKFMDRLVLMVAPRDSMVDDPDQLVAFADSLSALIAARLDPYVTRINGRVDDALMIDLYGNISEQLPVYLTEADYKTIDTLITPQRLRESLEQNIRTLSSPAGIALKSIISKDPVGISLLGVKKLQQLQYDESFELYDGYVMTKDRKNLLLFLTPRFPPSDSRRNGVFIHSLEEIIDSTQDKFPTVGAQYFGATAVSLGNAVQLTRDTLLTQGIILLFLIIFLGIYFRRKSAPLVILIPVVFGTLFSLMCIYIIRGKISLIAFGTASVVLSIAVNYSLHLFNHFRHTGDMEQVIRDLARPLTIGSITTIGGFLCLQFVESEMLRDLGLFAALSLMGAIICSLVFLPPLIKRSGSVTETIRQHSWLDRIAEYRPEYNKYLVLFILVLTIVLAYFARNVQFESELVNMNYMSPKLKQAETKLNQINRYALQSVYLVTQGNTLDEALALNEKQAAKIAALKEQGIVTRYSGVSSLILSDSLQKLRIDRWNRYWTPEKKQQVLAELDKAGLELGYRLSAFAGFRTMIGKKYSVAGKEDAAVFRRSLLDDFITEKSDHSFVVTLIKIPSAKRDAVYRSFSNSPGVTVLDKQYLTTRMVEIINADFNQIALTTSIFVFIVLLIMYGRIELTLVSFIPMLISWLWILGLMALLGIQFNIINIIISAIIFGLGDDYSLFIMDGLLQEYKTGKKNLSSFKSSIFLSAITTIAGLGVLIFAKHPALRSIAGISIIGILCVVTMSQILIPFFFRLIISSRVSQKQFPWTLFSWLRSAFAFTYFVIGCILLTVIGLICMPLKIISREKTKVVYHFILSGFAWSLMYIMLNVKKTIINPQGEDFRKPAVIIANHQSFLDILSLVMLHPKLILFTNDWVWNSPVFGIAVRMADYYPVSKGAEQSITLLEDRVKNGYSIVIFPEGTRSVDGNIRRFHKGAFFLAEQLKADILPVFIQGTGYAMTKSDFYLKNGNINIEVGERIQPDNILFGNGYAERSKNIGRYFRTKYAALVDANERDGYFRERLIANYLYKGPVLEWYLRIKVRLEKYYQQFNDLLPKSGKFLDAGCGYGFMSYMLSFTSPERRITGIDFDTEKIDVANHCFDRHEGINFKFANVLDFDFEQYDGIVLADMLHYLQPSEQVQVMEQCIRHLNVGGMIIIREGNADLKEKHRGTRLTEFFSTTFTRFNKTSDQGLSFLTGQLIREIAGNNNMECTEIDNSMYTSNMIFVINHHSAT